MQHDQAPNRRVISASCFRVLSLQLETQNEVDVLKPILEELEVLRLSCALGALPTMNPEDFEHGFFEPKEFDAEFARFLRADVFSHGDGTRATGPHVRVVGLYGKQEQVKHQLKRLSGWDGDMETKLRLSDQGMYAVVLPPKDPPADVVKTVVMFPWLLDGQFHPDRLRETPTYLVRLLTCVTSHVTCCLSSDDKALMDEHVANNGAMGTATAQQWRSYSVAFHVDQQQDQSDGVEAHVVRRMPLPAMRTTPKKIFVAKGTFPALMTVMDVPSEKARIQHKQSFDTGDKFCSWLCGCLDTFAVRTASSRWPLQAKEGVLRKFGKWPQKELDDIRVRFVEAVKAAEVECEAAVMRAWSDRRTRLFLAGEDAFRVDSLIDNQRTRNACQEVESCLLEIERDSTFSLSLDCKRTLKLPVRLPKMLSEFLELFCNRQEQVLAEVLSRAHMLTARELALNRTRGGVFSTMLSWASWFITRGDPSIPGLFRDRMRVPLETMRQLWWLELSNVLDAYVDHVLKIHVHQRISQMEEIRDAEMSKIVDDAVEKLSRGWAAASASSLSLDFSVYYGSNRKFNCTIEEEYYLHQREQLLVWKLKETTAASTNIDSCNLGKIDLVEGEVLVGCFTVQTRSTLKISTTEGRSRVVRIEFPAPTAWSTRSPVTHSVRELRRNPTMCDFNAADRTLVLGDEAGKFSLFRINDKCTSMEIMRTVDAAVKTSLAMPIADVLLSDGVLYLVDRSRSLQSLNTRNQQISRKLRLGSDADGEWNQSLFVVADGTALGWWCIEHGTPGLRFVAVDDLRALPLSMDSQIAFAPTDPLVYGAYEDAVFLVSKTGGTICEFAIEATMRSDSFRIRTTGGMYKHNSSMTSSPSEMDVDSKVPFSDHWLWAFYHLYEKFPVRGELERDCVESSTLRLEFVCEDEDCGAASLFEEGFRGLLTAIRERLELLNKPLYGMDFFGGDTRLFGPKVVQDLTDTNEAPSRSVSLLLQELTTFVPVQICRAESNTLALMSDGQLTSQDHMGISGNDGEVHSSDIARSLRFGLLSPLLTSWTRQCIVITSMGKQSTGKSYFLNHLTGSSFAISGARCTDGAWLSVRFLTDSVMLVVIDFEGLGSFERTEQEDVFLSVLNASVSMLTIFRMEMRLDKEIDELFSKFQKGSQLIKSDPLLFRGKLYMSVKDVNPDDQRGVVNEFVTKFQRLLAANKEHNFLTEMYAGQVDINCSPPLGTVGYYQSLTQAQHYIASELCGNPKAGFSSGKAFLDCIRLLLAKISILDWTSMDDSAVKFKVAEFLRKMPGVVRFGCAVSSCMDTASGVELVPGSAARDELLSESDGRRIHASFEEVCTAHPLMAELWHKTNALVDFDALDDEDIDLCASFAFTDAEQVAAASRAIGLLFTKFLQLRFAGDSGRHIMKKPLQVQFDAFLSFVIRRRCVRIQKWCRSVFAQRTPERWSAAEHQALGCVQTLFVRCLDSCTKCHLGCMKASVHSSSGDPVHDCGTNHACAGVCAYCSDMQAEGKTPRCSKDGGHEGRCECASGDHTCRQTCLLQCASNCGKECTKKAGHGDADSHRCAVGLHKCGAPCAAANCSRQCVLDIEVPHTAHKCEVDRCLARCVVDGCNRNCRSLDHFHGLVEAKIAFDIENPDLVSKNDCTFDASSDVPAIHICEGAHLCPDVCAQDGICHIDVLLKKSSKTFVGARDTFQYTFQEMNGSRKKCARTLEPGELTHTGAHTCVALEVEHDHDEDDESKLCNTTATSGAHAARTIAKRSLATLVCTRPRTATCATRCSWRTRMTLICWIANTPLGNAGRLRCATSTVPRWGESTCTT